MREAGLLVRIAIFFGGFGLLPLWAAIAIVYYYSKPSAAGYWAGAQWLIILSIPACLVTLGIAAVTVAVHDSTAGSRSRKLRMATLTFLALVLAVSAVAGGLWMRRENQRQELEAERKLAGEFVRSHPRVIQRFTENFGVSPIPFTTEDGLPVRYKVVIVDWPESYAMVDVSRKSGRPVFTLACLTPIPGATREPGKDPCAPL